jgi:hypothetical protein
METEDPRSLYGVVFGDYDMAGYFFSQRSINKRYPYSGNNTVSHVVLKDLNNYHDEYEREEIDSMIERLLMLGADFRITNDAMESVNDLLNQMMVLRDAEDAVDQLRQEEAMSTDERQRQAEHLARVPGPRGIYSRVALAAGDENSCPFCLEEFTESNGPHRYDRCVCGRVAYHDKCLDGINSRERNIKCPTCRSYCFGKKHKQRNSNKRKQKQNKKTRTTPRRRSFGYSHDYAPKTYGAHYSDGMLLANDAFSWTGNPLARALNSGS